MFAPYVGQPATHVTLNGDSLPEAVYLLVILEYLCLLVMHKDFTLLLFDASFDISDSRVRTQS